MACPGIRWHEARLAAAIHAGLCAAKFFLACFVGVHVLPAGLIADVVLFAGTPGPELAMAFGVLLAATLVGIALTLGTLHAALAPATQACRALVAYAGRCAGRSGWPTCPRGPGARSAAWCCRGRRRRQAG